MENFIVSARKYRPATFNTVVGQSHITVTLKNAIKNNHLAQAFLFCGPRGVGKTTCARILAKTINCQNPTPDMEACDECESCISFKNGSSMNVHELDAASNNSVDDIRSLVEQVRFAPPSGKYKIYIIDEVHMLSTSAFNAFLKTLEEPPPYAIFILATTEKHKIIPTILSRCQIFDFNRIQVEDIAHHLAFISESEHISAEAEALHTIAQKADGALRDALSIFDQIVSFAGTNLTYKSVIDNLNILDYDYYFRVTDAILAENTKDILLIFDEILNKGFDGNNCINGLNEHFRNLLVCKDPETIKLLKVTDQIKERYLQQSRHASASVLFSALNIGNQCDIQYKASKNQRLHVELALMKMCHITSALQLAQLPAETQEVKKKPEPVAKPQASEAKTAEQAPQKPVTDTPVIAVASAAATSVSPQIQVKPASANGSGMKLPKLNDLKSGNYTITREAEEEPKNVQLPEDPFDDEAFFYHWKACIESIRSKNLISLNSLLETLAPKRKSEYLFEIIFTNKIQADLFLSEKPELLGQIRKNLNNHAVDFVIEIDQTIAPDKPYTNSEKFKAMAEKNPNLLTLKEKLGLDPEF